MDGLTFYRLLLLSICESIATRSTFKRRPSGAWMSGLHNTVDTIPLIAKCSLQIRRYAPCIHHLCSGNNLIYVNIHLAFSCAIYQSVLALTAWICVRARISLTQNPRERTKPALTSSKTVFNESVQCLSHVFVYVSVYTLYSILTYLFAIFLLGFIHYYYWIYVSQ